MPVRRAIISAPTDGVVGLTLVIIRRLPVFRHHRPAIIRRRPAIRHRLLVICRHRGTATRRRADRPALRRLPRASRYRRHRIRSCSPNGFVFAKTI
jgi:hypothetical protein